MVFAKVNVDLAGLVSTAKFGTSFNYQFVRKRLNCLARQSTFLLSISSALN